ncbi:Putative ATP/GTP-binding protein [[Actinomadura] parvosata subsp. kistnae]|uniref:AAA+ ATPase domain-containing protein n=1 Tax=[Actinomadura] parvosata subsp. kistnae TaxID=1909395 RepID=A0A1V0A6G2_9ACTN|nr:tetratricopeptide repeat protein [Nonomuraea sp. ATCC 55076]AQZ65759.1 hypothetical protein BKM31_33680 [Nonomuraea sp. ATCC 55076]SPL97165.1 Putative ATP/GTP-binding protein [Actinomadura parvosata subsp. kistnae]
MPRWSKIVIAATLPSTAGVLAWWICVANGLGLDTTSIVVGLVVLLPGTPLAIWAGQAEPDTGPPVSGSRPAPAVIGDVPREPRAFQPRAQLSERIDQLLCTPRPAPVCALVGGRGVGKTHLAAAHARRCIQDGIPVAWLHAETADHLHGSLDQFAADTGLRSDGDDFTAVTRKARAWLQARREPYLVVLDNATDPDLLAPLLPAHGQARVLITTNDHAFERLGAMVPVEQFTEAEAVGYLRTRVSGDDDGFHALAEELDRLPLALGIAAAALVGPPRLSCASYLRRLRATPIEVILARPRGEPYPNGVAQAIMLSVGQTSPAAAHLLAELSVLSTSGVGIELLGPQAETALAELGARSLVTFSRGGTTVFVHRLVRRAVHDQAARDRILPTVIESAARRLCEAVEDISDQDTWRRFPLIMTVAEHGASLWEAVEQVLDDESPYPRASPGPNQRTPPGPAQRATPEPAQRTTTEPELPTAAEPAQPTAAEPEPRTTPEPAQPTTTEPEQPTTTEPEQWASAEPEQWASAEPEPRTTPEPELWATAEPVLRARHTVAAHLIYLNDGIRALPVAEAVVRGRERLLGPDHPDTLAALHTLAHAWEYAGQPMEAAVLYQRVAADRSSLLGAEHPDTLWSRASVAFSYTMAGKAAQAVPMIDQVVADQQRALSPNHPTLLAGRYFQAYTHCEAGLPEGGIELFRQLIADREQLFEHDDPDTWVVKGQLARAYKAAGRAAEAVPLYEHVAEQQTRVLGADHPDTLITRHGLAAAYEAVGRIADAVNTFAWVTYRFEAVMGPEQLLTRTARADLERARRSLRQP